MQPVKIDIHALENIHFAGEKMTAIEMIEYFNKTGYSFVKSEKKQEFLEGMWYVHEESPGFLIRIENVEKSICSGWTGAGRVFKNNYTYLSPSRLRIATVEDVKWKADIDPSAFASSLDRLLEQDLKPIRLGRHKQIAVLDDRNFGHEVLIFNKKYMHLAPQVVDFLNRIK